VSFCPSCFFGDTFNGAKNGGDLMKAVRLWIVLCLMLSLAACSLKPSWDMAGKWQSADGKETLEFARSGRVIYESGSTSLTTPYKFSNASQLVINLGSLGSCMVETSVSKKTLTLTDANGHINQFQKVK
jgi:hypothetical protein